MANTNTKGLLVAFIALLLPLVASLRSISLSDFWMHIAQGQAGILRSETFSFSSEGVKFVDVHWLYNLLTTALFTGGGSSLVILFHTMAIVAGFVLLILAAKRYASGFSLAFAVILSTWLMMVKLGPRPVLLAMPFIALMIYALENRKGGAKEWVLIGIGQWFWMGIHPSFLLGPLLCVGYAFSRSREQNSQPKDFKNALIGAGVALGVSLLNPYGPGLHLWAFSNLPLTYMPVSLTNLSSASDAMGADWFRIVLYVALATAGGGLLTYREKLPLAVTGAAVATAFMSVMAVGRISYHLLAIFGFLFFSISFKSIGIFLESHLKDKPALLTGGSWGLLAAVLLGSLAPLLSGGFFQSVGSPSRLGLGLNQQVVKIKSQPSRTENFYRPSNQRVPQHPISRFKPGAGACRSRKLG